MNTEVDNSQPGEILSQEETDALLQGIETGSIETGTGQTVSGEVIPYDFAECDRLTRGSMPTLQIINTRMANHLSHSLSDFLRQDVQVDAEGNFMQRFGDHLPTLSMPACLNLVRLAPLPGTILIAPEVRLIQVIVDRFFGGKGKLPENPPVREFTQVENRMVLLVIERVFEAITESWESIIDLKPELIGQEQDPRFGEITNKRDTVVISDFSIGVAEETLKLQLVIPRASLAPVEEALDAAPRKDKPSDSTQWQLAIRERLRQSRIGLRATLTQTTLRLGDVLNLQPGDVIRVDLPENVIVEAAGTALFSARTGTSRNRNAVEIVSSTRSTLPVKQN